MERAIGDALDGTKFLEGSLRLRPGPALAFEKAIPLGLRLLALRDVDPEPDYRAVGQSEARPRGVDDSSVPGSRPEIEPLALRPLDELDDLLPPFRIRVRLGQDVNPLRLFERPAKYPLPLSIHAQEAPGRVVDADHDGHVVENRP